MLDEVAIYLTEHGIAAIYPMALLMLLRPLGLMYGFIAMVWALKRSTSIRATVALCFAFPTVVPHLPQLEQFAESTDVFYLAPIALKEFALGYGLGFLASLPFYALQYAGAITDTFRGESDSGIVDPQGGSLHTFALCYVVIGLFAFFSAGGLWTLVENLYRSYDVWPLIDIFPKFDQSSREVVMALLFDVFITAIQIALPLFSVLLLIEFTTAISARLARRFGLYELAFPLKNLLVVLSLPLLMWIIWKQSDDNIAWSSENLIILQAITR